MKYFVVPAAVLALLFGLSLENARLIRTDTANWLAAMDEATASAEREDWDAARDALRGTHTSWDERKPWLHIVTAHDELEAADALFAATESFATEQDMAEFRAGVAQLAAQLAVVSQMQQLTLRNVL